MYVVFGLISILISCKQNPEPENLEQQIPIELKGMVNGKEFLLSLGQEGTTVRPQAYRESDQTLVLTTELGLEEELRFKIRANREPVIHPDEVLRNGLYRFYIDPSLSDSSAVNRTKIVFKPEDNKPIKQVFWRFEDGSVSTKIQPEKLFTASGLQNVYLSVVYQDGCEASAQLPVRIHHLQNTGELKMAWSFPDNNRELILQTSFPDSSRLNTVNWEVNGTPVGQPGRALKFECPDSGIYQVCAWMINAGDTLQICQLIQTPDTRSCRANFTASGTTEQDQPTFYSVEVSYKDAQGNLYSSSEIIQNAASYFEIQQLNPFINTREGKQSKIAKLKFSCLLKGKREIITLKDFAGKIAFQVEE